MRKMALAAAMLLTGGALRRLEAITPPGMAARLSLTITDEPPLAQAVVIITAEPHEAREPVIG